MIMNVLEMDLTEPEIIEKVSRSLALGEDINELDDQGKTILDYALLSPHRFLVHYLLRGGARVGFQSFFSTFTKNRFFNGPAFGQFLAEGNHDVARIFLNMIDCNSSKKNFYIFYAKKCIRYKQFNGLLTSISVEPNISLKQEILKEVFFLAIETRKLQLILALLDIGFSIHVLKENGDTPLHLLLKTSRFPLLVRQSNSPVHSYSTIDPTIILTQLFCERGMQVTYPGESKITPLMLACYAYNPIPLIEVMLKFSHDIDQEDASGCTVLHHLMKRPVPNRVLLAKVLRKDLRVNAVDQFGKTALYLAVERFTKTAEESLLPIINDLIINGADMNYPNNEGVSAFDLALSSDDQPLVNFLRSFLKNKQFSKMNLSK